MKTKWAAAIAGFFVIILGAIYIDDIGYNCSWFMCNGEFYSIRVPNGCPPEFVKKDLCLADTDEITIFGKFTDNMDMWVLVLQNKCDCEKSPIALQIVSDKAIKHWEYQDHWWHFGKPSLVSKERFIEILKQYLPNFDSCPLPKEDENVGDFIQMGV
jgi:hypothetical protein